MPLAARLCVVASEAAPLRRELGPLAWFIFEELVLAADRDPTTGELRAAIGVRDLAASLGMSKDTAARGVTCLIAAGVVRRVVSRSQAGRFGSCRYVLSLPAGLARVAPDDRAGSQQRGVSGESAARLPARARTAARRSRPSRQLSLIDS